MTEHQEGVLRETGLRFVVQPALRPEFVRLRPVFFFTMADAKAGLYDGAFLDQVVAENAVRRRFPIEIVVGRGEAARLQGRPPGHREACHSPPPLSDDRPRPRRLPAPVGREPLDFE